jgi:hypothetical protein
MHAHTHTHLHTHAHTRINMRTPLMQVLSTDQVAAGFVRLLSAADDLVLDCPDVVHLLALFLGRAIVDEVLPPAFLTQVCACVCLSVCMCVCAAACILDAGVCLCVCECVCMCVCAAACILDTGVCLCVYVCVNPMCKCCECMCRFCV